MPLAVFLFIALCVSAVVNYWHVILGVLGALLVLLLLCLALHNKPPAPKPKEPTEKFPIRFKKKKDCLLASSMTKEGVWYAIDPEHVSCTCPDWVERRSEDSPQWPSSVCKHLAKYYENRPKKTPACLQPWRPLIRRMAAHDMGVPTRDAIFVFSESGDPAAMISFYGYSEEGWVHVHIGYFEYGYNPAEKRWSYKNEPPNAEWWVRIIRDSLAGKPLDDKMEYPLDT